MTWLSEIGIGIALAVIGFSWLGAYPHFGQIHGLQLTKDLILPVIMPWILFTLSCLLFVSAGRIMGFSRSTVGALIITAGLATPHLPDCR